MDTSALVTKVKEMPRWKKVLGAVVLTAAACFGIRAATSSEKVVWRS